MGGLKGASGPPRIVFPNPGPITDGVRRSVGCLTGPFVTGIKGADNVTDTGAGFRLSQIEANPAGFFTDSHTALFVPGVVRGQLDQSFKLISIPPTGDGTAISGWWDGDKLEALIKLATNDSRDEESSVGISEETSWVGLDLRESESSTSICDVVGALDAGDEWSSQTSDTASNTISHWTWVRECNAWRTRCSLQSLVNVGGSQGRRLIISSNSCESDIVADGIGVGVDGIVELANSTWLTWSWSTGAGDDLIRSGRDVEDGGEVGRYDSSKSCESE